MTMMFRILIPLALMVITLQANAQPLYLASDKGPYLMYSDSKALVIGATQYQESAGWPSLPKVPGQVERVTKALQEQGFTVQSLADPKSGELSVALKKFLVQRMDKNTRLLVYFAGHGWSDGNLAGYIVPTDAPNENDDAFISTLINMEEIVGWGRKSSAKHVLFVFDSCFSGSVFLVRKNQSPSTSALYLNDIDRPGRQYLTAGGYREQVPDIDDFSGAFIAGIGGMADYNGDKIVTANELGPFIRDQIIPRGNQTPQFGPDTNFEWKLGDTVFAPMGPQQIAYAADASGPRNSALRGLGEPRPEQANVFQNVEVLYYRKLEDKLRVTETLDAKKIPYVVTTAQLPDKFPVNTIACAPDVPVEALKEVTLALFDKGIPVRRIMTFRKPSEKPRRIEILSTTKDGAGKVALDSAPLTRDQIEKISSCPRILEN
ncbi:caspase family protein [Rhizobium leguminosarum]|uniref:caspase family protein n=1 Tax=Rhizobium leguminosarum TaxID=384 RepID=UPI00103D57ED|nr:caspase family protein [Rhizobium leguminosarum]TBZ06251.1 hypothetical protein E0H38_33090 [Rhizobium leguminosarum bv. viciae]